jgi:uncharacterized protein (TIGR02172 family)
MNKNLGTPTAYGRTAEIYAWQNGQILKLFHDWFELDNIQYELKIARAVESTGLPVPHAGEILRVNERNGLTYSRVDGISMLDDLQRRPWKLPRYARRTAELHAAMHACTVQASLPSQQKRLERKINQAACLPSDLRTKALEALNSMPGGDRLCHGDFHPGNIMVNGQGETVIDWIDSSLGNPLGDLARTSIICLGAVESDQIPEPAFKFTFRLFLRVYLRHYFALRPGGEVEYSRWLPIVAAARLNENIPELEGWLIARVREGFLERQGR